MSTGPTIRCFIAVDPDEAARADLLDAARLIDAEPMRRPPAENLHLTVKFLGDCLPDEITRLIEVLPDALAEAGACELESTGFIAMPNDRRPRVVAMGFERSEAIVSLFDLVEMASEDVGFPREGRAYRPHVTLGRFNARRRPPRDFRLPTETIDQMTLPIDHVVIKQSILEPSGAVYQDLARFELCL